MGKVLVRCGYGVGKVWVRLGYGWGTVGARYGWGKVGGKSGVRLGFRLRRDGDTQSHEYPHRFDLTGAVAPGETASMTGYITAPTEPGVYVIKVDLVAEGVTWFEAQGSRPIELRLEVEPAG